MYTYSNLAFEGSQKAPYFKGSMEFPKQWEGYHIFKQHNPLWENEYFVEQFV